MAIQWQAAPPAVRPYVLGFIERMDAVSADASLQLPFAIPVIHVALGSHSPHASISVGATAARLVVSSGPIQTFVIALGFSGASLLAQDDLSQLSGQFTALDSPDWRIMMDELASAPDFAARMNIAVRFLTLQIARSRHASTAILSAADAIAQDRWSGRVTDLAHQLGIEQRTLRNRFKREVGWSPKRLLSVARFNRALRGLHPRPWTGPPRADFRLEFFDDAHFHHQFCDHAGISPAEYVAAKQRSADGLVHNVCWSRLPRRLAP